MTKNEIIYAFKQLGIDPNNYKDSFTTAEDTVLYISFADAARTKFMDKEINLNLI